MPPFDYPDAAHTRRHGPSGYVEYSRYKPWLRDEFRFQCVYCFFRERWFPTGLDAFSVDHVVPQSKDEAELFVNNYEFLLYSCIRCNSIRQDDPLPADPCSAGFAAHLSVADDGTISARTAIGAELIETFGLDRSKITGERGKFIRLWKACRNREDAEGRQLFLDFFGFPLDLPDLSTRSPDGNSRPEGIDQSYYARAAKHELPPTY